MTERSCHRIHRDTGVECKLPDTRDAHNEGHNAGFTSSGVPHFAMWPPDLFDSLRWDRAARSAQIPDHEFDAMLERNTERYAGLLDRLDKEDA